LLGGFFCVFFLPLETDLLQSLGVCGERGLLGCFFRRLQFRCTSLLTYCPLFLGQADSRCRLLFLLRRLAPICLGLEALDSCFFREYERWRLLGHG